MRQGQEYYRVCFECPKHPDFNSPPITLHDSNGICELSRLHPKKPSKLKEPRYHWTRPAMPALVRYRKLHKREEKNE